MPLNSYETYLVARDKDGRIFVSKCYNTRMTQSIGEYRAIGIQGPPITTFEATLDWIKCLQRDEVSVFDLTEDEVMKIFEEE